mgnify:CR=1 FL=1
MWLKSFRKTFKELIFLRIALETAVLPLEVLKWVVLELHAGSLAHYLDLCQKSKISEHYQEQKVLEVLSSEN